MKPSATLPVVSERSSMQNQRKASSLLSITGGVPGVTTILSLKRKVSELRRRRQMTPAVCMEPTYRMEPKSGEVYTESKVVSVVEACHNFYLKRRKYEANEVATLCKIVNDDIRKQLLAAVTCPRYKIVVYTTIWPNSSGSSISIFSRTLMDNEKDNYVSVNFESSTLKATSIVFWIYFE